METLVTTRATACPYCGVGCGVDAGVRGDDIIAVSGTASHPANLGRLCVKGSALHETTGLAGRLLHPQVRGQRVSWDSAMAEVAGSFARIIAEHGPDAVAFYLSGQLLTEDYYVANKLMKGFIGSANVDTNSRLCMASAVAGYKRAFGADAVPCSYRDLETCDLLVMVGSNAAWTHPVLYQRIAAAKARRPQMRVVVIDPRRTASCDLADLHLAIRPGSDAHLFVGLLHYLYRNERLDRGYIAAHTQGFEHALAEARNTSLESLAQVVDVASSDLQRFFSWFAGTDKTVTFYSQGVNQSATGTDKCNAIINCHLATGRIGREGTGPFSITGQPNAMGGREVGGLANQLAAHMDFTPEAIDRVGRFWGSDRVATRPGLKAVDMFDAIHRGQIKAVWIMATNPVVSLPDADRVKAALAKCELVVVSDCSEQTDTTACAHILLPATGWGEKDGTVTNSERRISRQRPLRRPPGEARHDWQIVCDLASRLGYGEAFGYPSAAAIFREHATLSGFENGGDRAFDISGLAMISDKEYEEFTPRQWPLNAVNPEGVERLFSDGRFFTANRRARFVAVTPAQPRQNRDGQYPFVLNTGRVRDQWHTMTRTALAPRLLNHIDGPLLTIHTADAAALEVAGGDLVEVSNARGSLRLQVAVDNSVRQGELFLPIHWNDQFASHGRIGALVAPEVDPHSGQPESKYVPVALRKLAVKQWLQIVSQTDIDTRHLDYWLRVPVVDGVRYRCAVLAEAAMDTVDWLRTLVPCRETLEFEDPGSGDYRLLGQDAGGIVFAAFVSSSPGAQPEGSWLAELIANNAGSGGWKALAGGKGDGQDKGRLVCSCFEVGEGDIARAICAGANTPRALGQQLRCGTNCGSCIPELKGLIAALASREDNAA